jgi:hypothetical protein
MPKTETSFAFRCSLELRDWLGERADAENRKASDWLRLFLEQTRRNDLAVKEELARALGGEAPRARAPRKARAR